MHDWTLVSVLTEWDSKRAVLTVIDRSSTKRELGVEGVRKLLVLHEEPWGASVSILSLEGPEPIDDDYFRLRIRMQTGDDLEIEAKRFDVPN